MKRTSRFLGWQITEIRQGGVDVLLRKLRLLFLILVAALPAILTVAAMRLLRPFLIIRFARLRTERIGHFAVNTELYLCGREHAKETRRNLDIFYVDIFHDVSFIANRQLLKMWRRVLHVAPFYLSPILSLADAINRLLPDGNTHSVAILSIYGDVQSHGLLARTPPHLSFTQEEEEWGRTELERLGVPKGAPFICFHARDSAYLEQTHSRQDWGYFSHRDTHIQNYLPAAEAMTERGYFAVRVGAVVERPLETSNKRVIDYATNGSRTEFMDLFLGAKSEFFIYDTAGLYGLAAIFRRPIVSINLIPLQHLNYRPAYFMFIPKKLWLRKERRLLTFREILTSSIGWLDLAYKYEEMDIEVIENSPEEVTAVVLEVHERLQGTWRSTKDDEELQARFRSFLDPAIYKDATFFGIGADFLRRNRQLLD